MAAASQAVSRRVVSVEGSRRLAEVASEIEQRRATHCVVLSQGVPRGVVRMRELASASSLRLLADLAVPCPSVPDDAPLERAVALFQTDGVDSVIVLHQGQFLGLITPESLLAQLLEEQTQLAAEQSRTSRAKDDFLAALSHELRTPLQPVLLLASAAAENPDLPPQVREDFAFIRKHVELEARLIDDLLDLTRIAQNKLVLHRSPTDFREILRDAVDIVGEDVRAKGIVLSVQWPPPGVRVSADPVRLQQVYWNVLKNAVKFTPAGGRISVEAGLAPDGRQMTVAIADSGIGIKAAELEHIFDTFAQGDHAQRGSHRFGGLGLGLAISRKLMELHGGRIFAASKGPQLGSTFVIELPVLPAS
jgi:signal transduction histidine kinase